MKKRKLLFTMLALSLGCLSGGSGAMAQSTNNGWNAILSQTQTTSDDWTPITEGTTQGKILGAAQSGSNATYYYYVTKSLNFTNNRTDNDDNGNSGLKIHGTVYLYVPAGLTITCEGANADGRTGAGAGIELASGNTLYIIGGGTVIARGGNAENGRNGGDGTNADGDNGNSWTQTGTGGTGGNGGGGAGAGIGTRGGTGGTGGSGGAGYKYDDGAEDDAENGTNGSNGTIGGSAGAMGTLYVANGTMVNTTGGSAGTSGGAGGQRGKSFAYDGSSYNVTTGAGGGGGGGGFGGAASNIGTGGRGGGGGGGGAGGAQDWRSNSSGGVYCVYANGGKGGQNANGNYAADGTDADTNGTAHANGWVYVANGSFNTTSDWNSESGDCSFGSRGSGGARGTNDTSAGTQNKGKLEYTITYHWAVPEVTTTTVKYSPSTGASVILPQNTIDGYQWALGVYGKDCHVSGSASEFTTASKEFYGGNIDATANRTIYLKDVYGNLDFYEVKSVCMLKNSGDNTQEIGDFFVADNNPNANAPKWPITVRLQDRTLYKDGKWNSICLPFGMTKDQVAASPLAGATIKKLNTYVSGYYPSGQVNKGSTQSFDYGHPVVLFWFDDVNLNNEDLVAGMPYLVKWEYGSNLVDDTTEAENDGDTPTHQLDFNYVTVKETTAGSWVGAGTSDGNVNFVGTFSSTQLTGGDQTKLILGPNNKLYYPSENLSVAACRGFFTIPSTAAAAALVMGFDDDETTGIQTIDITPEGWNNAPAIYNLSGQRLNSLQKGINIVNGKKVVVK